MKEWNVVVTSHMNQERRLLRELEPLGEFHPSGFREVIIGQVPDVPGFLEILRQYWAEKPFFPHLLSTVVPLRVVFAFTLENLLLRLKEEALALGPEIGDAPFYVRMKRRGHKGELSSLEVEQALDEFLKEELAARGQRCHIDFDQAEVILIVETIHNQCGLGLVTREMKERYSFIKVK
jgi:tRNA(Ser,Leu) C12 N-acetylase TAN1